MVILLGGITFGFADFADSLPRLCNLNGQLDTCRMEKRRRQEGSGIHIEGEGGWAGVPGFFMYQRIGFSTHLVYRWTRTFETGWDALI